MDEQMMMEIAKMMDEVAALVESGEVGEATADALSATVELLGAAELDPVALGETLLALAQAIVADAAPAETETETETPAVP